MINKNNNRLQFKYNKSELVIGNIISNNSNNSNNVEKSCLICWDKIVENIDCVVYIRCNIKLHAYCEQRYRGEKGYCKCPHCQGIGTLGY